MFNDISKPPPPLPSPSLTELMPGVSLLQPLSRRGTGPGVIILTHNYDGSLAINEGVPSPLVKWAEEGYAVVEVQARALSTGGGGIVQSPTEIIQSALGALRSCGKCEPKDKVGLIAYEPDMWNAVASTLSDHPSIAAAAVYADAPSDTSSPPKPLAGATIPMTGGIGRLSLSSFYQHNFIFNNSADTELELISRTQGIDRIVDEFIFKFTHDRMLDWMLPGVPPTHKKVEVPFTAVVNIRGDRLYHEHILWDQSSVLRQLGLLPEYLPFPYPIRGETQADSGKSLEYRLPVAGIETTHKMRDRTAGPSNGMFDFKIREL